MTVVTAVTVMTMQVVPNHGDASLVCYMHRDDSKQFDVLDLDPYGAPTPFIDGAVQVPHLPNAEV